MSWRRRTKQNQRIQPQRQPNSNPLVEARLLHLEDLNRRLQQARARSAELNVHIRAEEVEASSHSLGATSGRLSKEGAETFRRLADWHATHAMELQDKLVVTEGEIDQLHAAITTKVRELQDSQGISDVELIAFLAEPPR